MVLKINSDVKISPLTIISENERVCQVLVSSETH